uniref:Uncharacterized protein n=1 Tax=Moniliophthora roreri TaxID=221103 RepID=A0A0W0FXN6_MONRR
MLNLHHRPPEPSVPVQQSDMNAQNDPIPSIHVGRVSLDQNSILTTDTYATDDTGSSATTIWGPGTLSGKAIKSLGEASLRGVEKLLIRWKFAKISQVLASEAKNGKLEKIHDDLLELSRLDFYDAKVRHKALRLIMMQIGSGETTHLTMCIVKWPRGEIRIFLSEMFAFMPLLWKDASRPVDSVLRNQLDLITIYRTAQTPNEGHEIIPFLTFISRLADENHTARVAVIEAGLIGFLVAFHQDKTIDAPDGTAEARGVLSIFLSDPQLRTACEFHRLNLVWPRGSSHIPLTKYSLDMGNLTPNRRRLAWRSAERAKIRERLCEIQVVLGMPVYFVQDCEKDIFDVCFDLISFPEIMMGNRDWDLRRLALSLLLRCLAISPIVRSTLKAVLVMLSFEENLDFFHRIIYPLLHLETGNSSIVTQLSEAIHTHHTIKDPIDYFVDFAVDVASGSQTSARAVLDADIISLLSHTTHDPNTKGELLARFVAAAGFSQPYPNPALVS